MCIRDSLSRWLERILAYGFEDGKDFTSVKSSTLVNNGAEREIQDYDVSVDMAKQICMIQRSEKGKQYRQYFLDLEKAWNSPEQIMARALQVAGREIERLKSSNAVLIQDVQRMKPKEIFADAVSSSHTSILIGDLAKLLKQNGYDTGQKRLFEQLRNEGFLMKEGSSKNMPTQKAMDMGLFEVKEGSYVDANGCNVTTKTTKVTGKGQQYFIFRYLQRG